MPKNPRPMRKVVVGPRFAAWTTPMMFQIDLDGTTTRTVALFRAIEPVKVRAASYSQEADTDGDKVLKIRNLTRAVDITNDLDIDALAANAGAAFVLSTTQRNLEIDAGDLIGVVYTVNTAGTTGPAQTGIMIEAHYL